MVSAYVTEKQTVTVVSTKGQVQNALVTALKSGLSELASKLAHSSEGWRNWTLQLGTSFEYSSQGTFKKPCRPGL